MQPQKQMIDTQLPFPGVTSLRGDIIQTDIEIAKQEYAMTLRDVLSEVKKTFYDLAYIHHAIEITKENRVLLEQMLDVASQKFEAGNTSYNDVINARISLSKLTDNLITLEDQSTTIDSRLNFLLNRSPNAPIGQVLVPNIQAMKIKLDHLYELAQEKRQEIQKMSLMIHRTDLMIDLAQEMNRPDPTLGASYFQERSGLLVGSEPDRETFQSAPRQQLRPWFGQRESFIAEMQERKYELTSKLDNLMNQTLFEIKNAHFSLDVAYRETELYRTTLIPEARQSLEVSETDYLGARIDFLDYLDAQRTWLDFNLAFYKAQSTFGKARAELERNLGSSLQINSQTNNQ
jgi:outer membrane protein TolC